MSPSVEHLLVPLASGSQRSEGGRRVDRRNRRSTRIAAMLALLVLIATFVVSPIGSTDAATGEVRVLTLPIHPDRINDVEWTDTYGAPRGGGRSHIGVDMLGEKMIPLLAVRSGEITWGRFSNSSGSILRFRDDDGWEYQYIHLNNDSPGTDDGSATCAETFSHRLCAAIVDGRFVGGTRITEGEIIGYLGDGGNAEHTRAHLHFEIYRPSGSGVVPINPTPSVDAARARILASPPGGSEVPAVAPGEAGFVDHLSFRLNGRLPTSDERAAFEAASGADGVWAAIAGYVDGGSRVASIDRLYLAFLGRHPDAAGIRYWVEILAAGHRLEDVAEWFADSEEFRQRYDGLGFEGYLERLYIDVLGRSPDAEGLAYWLGRLEDGALSRGTIVVQFTESIEVRELSGHRNELIALSLVLGDGGGTVPTEAELEAWVLLRATNSFGQAAATRFGGS